ncbi:MAG: glycosyltransferase family 9 protein [Cyclobacteriaceae bacterium]|nr:glycosyltransferase family 9 protein [Cyclobacteriaceae bacterium]
MAKKSLERILIIQTAFLGDVILATGLVEKIYQHYPEVEIDFLVRKGYESLFDSHPKIRRVIIFDKTRHKSMNLPRVIRKIRSLKYDMVINVQRFISTGLITVLSGATISVGFDKNPLSLLFSKRIKHRFDGEHETGRNHKLVGWFTDDEPGRPALYPQHRHLENITAYRQGNYICLAPASIWFTKQFPVEKWLEIIGLAPNQMIVYLVGGSGDRSLGEEIRARAGSGKVINLCGELGFLDTAALMRGASMNFVNDSAPMHMASAMNAPVCAIYCSTLPSFGFGPLSDRSFILEIRDNLYCRPCGIHGRKKCPEGHFRCACDIGVDQMAEVMGKLE